MKCAIVRFILIVALCLVLVPTTSCSRSSNKDDDSQIVLDEVKNTEDTTDNDTDSRTEDTDDTLKGEKDSDKGNETMNDTAATDEVKTLWKFQTGGGIASSPAIKENILYVGSKDGNFYALDRETGKQVWKYESGNPVLCQAVILDNTVFFSSKEVYFAVDAQTGTEIWKYDLKADAGQTARNDQWDYHDSSPVINKGVVYFGSGTGSILGFDVASGKVVWNFSASDTMAVRSTPLIQDGVIYYGDWSGKYRAVDIATKKILWENNYSKAFQNAAVMKDGVIFIGGRDTMIHAIDITTGESKWDYKEPVGSWFTGDPVIAGDILYFPTSDAMKVYAMNVKDGTVAVEYPTYKNSFSKAVIDNGLLYATSGDAYLAPGTGKLQIYKLNDNKNCVWEVYLKTGGIFTSPLLADGMVYFGSEDGCLYAYAVK